MNLKIIRMRKFSTSPHSRLPRLGLAKTGAGKQT